MLFNVIKDILLTAKSNRQPGLEVASADLLDEKSEGLQLRKVLNVGGNSKAIAIPPYYDGWDHLLLDVDHRGEPDIICDSRKLVELAPRQFDAIYCSHNLEHYLKHDVTKVLAGFHHVLLADGFVDIRVPDMGALMREVVAKGLDIEDFLYQSPAGPILVSDVIYGWGREIEESGNDFFAHKTGFTEKSLVARLHASGFGTVFSAASNLEVQAIGFKSEPPEFAIKLLGLESLLVSIEER